MRTPALSHAARQRTHLRPSLFRMNSQKCCENGVYSGKMNLAHLAMLHPFPYFPHPCSMGGRAKEGDHEDRPLSSDQPAERVTGDAYQLRRRRRDIRPPSASRPAAPGGGDDEVGELDVGGAAGGALVLRAEADEEAEVLRDPAFEVGEGDQAAGDRAGAQVIDVLEGGGAAARGGGGSRRRRPPAGGSSGG